jgi:hypothetical protein
MKKLLPLLLTSAILFSQPALAASNAKLLGTFEDWKAYSFLDGKSKSCFMSSKPTEQKGKFSKRGDVLLFITHWPEDNTKNVVSVAAGYAYKTGSEASLTIDDQEFKMITKDESAWTKDQATDDAIAAAMRKGSSVHVDGISKRSTKTTDIYSLKGSAAAYEAISKECAQ